MAFNRKKTAAVGIAAVMALGALTGCDLVSTDLQKDYAQVVAEVDITKSEAFAEGGEYAAYADAIEPFEIVKRDLVSNFMSIGYLYVESYGYSYADTYELIKNSLVNRAIYLQYAKAYFFKSGEYTVEGYEAAVNAAEEGEKDIAGLAYFLDEEEQAMAEYEAKVAFNSAIDSLETAIIDFEDEHDHEDARTTPTGVDTVDEDFIDPAYKVYTGSNSASDCGSYETVERSTPSTRTRAYKRLLSNLNSYGLIEKGENTSDVTSLSYFHTQRKSTYEDAVIEKLGEAFEAEAEGVITEEWVKSKYEETLASQKQSFSSDTTSFESALDSVSDTSFVLYAPDENYGFVLNILLPFSSTQSAALDEAPADRGDKNGNKFMTRASLLESVRATDQRRTWFTGHNDYSFVAEEADNAYTGGNAEREYLFFENNMKKSSGENAQYEPIPNYYGKYTYNGAVDKTEGEHGKTEFTITPEKITIDGFLSEMEGYLSANGYTLEKTVSASESYYDKALSEYYNEDGTVNYSSFVYYEAKVNELSDFNANNVFVAGSDENNVMSMMNELSFAYNTDTAGLNSYLGYAISPNSTDYMKEFEYAAQKAVRGGAGTIVVVPTDYGWHIIYCTFTFAGNTPYTFDWNEIEEEGTFSNLYYEALKSSNLTTYATDRQTGIINSYDNDTCVTVYEKRYQDLILDGSENDPHAGHDHS